MKQHLLGVCQPGGTPEPDALAQVMKNRDVLNEETWTAGPWVFEARPHSPGTGTVLRSVAVPGRPCR